MIEPNPQTISIINENILNFPKSFFFFSHLLKTSPSFEWISKIIMFFTYLQLFALTLTPLILNQKFDGRINSLSRIFFLFTHYSFNEPQYSSYSYLLFDEIIIFSVISFFILMTFFFYLCGYRIHPFTSSIRGMLIIFSPVNCFIPINIHFCYAIKESSELGISNTNIIVTIAFSILLFFGFYGFTSWAAPLLLQTPLLSKGHIPSRLLPDLSYVRLSVIYSAGVSYALCSSTRSAFFFSISFSVFFGIFQLSITWKMPFCSIYDTAMVLSISLSMILNPLIALIPYYGVNFDDLTIFGTAIAIFIIVYVSMYLICLFRQNMIIGFIHKKNFEDAINNKIFLYIQTALLNGTLSQPLLHHITKYYEVHPTNNLFFIYWFCYMLSDYQLDANNVDHALTLLANINSLSWSKRFIAFELYRSFTQTMTLPVPIPKIEKLEKLIKKYNSLQMKFWDQMITGKMNEGIETIHRLRGIYTQASQLYEKLRQFYKYHIKILNMESTFFMIRRKHAHSDIPASLPPNITCDIQERFSQFIKKQSLNFEVQINEDHSTATLTESSDNRTMSFISNNLHKILDKPLPLPMYFLVLILFLILIASFTVLSYPIFDIYNSNGEFSMIPIAFNQMRDITRQWSNLNIAMKHMTDCTEDVYLDCDGVFEAMNIPNREPSFIICKTIKTIVDSVSSTAYLIHREAEEFSNSMATFKESNILSELYSTWYQPTISLFPFSSPDMIIYNTTIDIYSTLSLFTDLLRFTNSDAVNDKCDVLFTQFAKQNKNWFFNLSTALEINLDQSLQNYKAYIDLMKSEYSSHGDWQIYIAFLSLVIASLLFCALIILYKDFHFYNTLKLYFRPNQNPYTDKVYSQLEKEDKLHIKFRSLYFLIIFFLMNVAFFIQFYFLYGLIIETRLQVINECNAIIEIGNVAQHISLEIISLLRYFEDKENQDLKNNLIDVHNDLIDSLKSMMASVSPLNIQLLWNKNPISIESERCLRISNDNFTIHDVVSCWPVSRQASILFFYSLTNGTEFSVNSSNFQFIQHLYTTHIMDDFSYFAEVFTSFTQETLCQLNLYCMIEIGFYALFIIFAFLLTSWRFLELSSLYRQIVRLFQVLLPEFIASHQCLMNFIIENEENENKKTVVKSLFSVYDEANLAVLVVSDHTMIVSFTKGVQTLFGYRAEQLIGQPLSILIPRTIANNVSHNSSSYYMQLAKIKKNQVEPVFTRDLLGRASDGTEIQLHVRTSMVEVDDLDFFVIEFKSMAQMYHYDLAIQKHKDYMDETISMTMPLALFSEMNSDGHYIISSYQRFILIYIMAPKPEDYLAISEINDFGDAKQKIEQIIPYYNGADGAIVLDASCSHVCILFVDYANDFESLFMCAWQFLVSYILIDQMLKSGFMITGSDLTLLMFPPPDVPEGIESSPDPISDSRKSIPTMTLEPFSQVMNYIPQLIEILKPNKIIISTDLEPYIEDTTFSKVQSDIPYSLSSYDIA